MWQIAGGGWQALLRLASTAVLARLLLPGDFGIVAMALLVDGLVGQMSVLGAAHGVIARREVGQDDLSTAFWLNAGVNAVQLAGAWLAAPWVAAFFREPAVVSVIRFLAVKFLFAAAGSVHGTLMTKRLQFGALTLIGACGVAIEVLVSLGLVWVFHLGYWGLIWGVVVAEGCMVAARMVYCRWMPSFRFDPATLRYLMRYGVTMLGSQAAIYIRSNMGSLVVGRFLGADMLGFYSFAGRFPTLISQRLVYPAAGVVFPAMSKLQGGGDPRLAAAYVRAAKFLALLSFPLLAGLVALAPAVVHALWGSTWHAAVTPLRILCFSAAIHCVAAAAGSIFLCKNRPDALLKLELIAIPMNLVSIGLLTYYFGLNGAALGTCSSIVHFLVALRWAFRLTGAPLSRFFTDMLPPVLASAVCGACAWGLQSSAVAWGLHPTPALPASVLAGGLAYAAALRWLFPDTWAEVWHFAGSLRGGRAA